MQNVHLNKLSQSQHAQVIPTKIKKSVVPDPEAALRPLPAINRAANSKSYLINSPRGNISS